MKKLKEENEALKAQEKDCWATFKKFMKANEISMKIREDDLAMVKDRANDLEVDFSAKVADFKEEIKTLKEENEKLKGETAEFTMEMLVNAETNGDEVLETYVKSQVDNLILNEDLITREDGETMSNCLLKDYNRIKKYPCSDGCGDSMGRHGFDFAGSCESCDTAGAMMGEDWRSANQQKDDLIAKLKEDLKDGLHPKQMVSK